jgi:hypothetical protein
MRSSEIGRPLQILHRRAAASAPPEPIAQAAITQNAFAFARFAALQYLSDES